jgi:predicted anti-sigma-YlaC factor YlaD
MNEVHLNDEQFAEALDSVADETVATHLAHCAECRAELGRVNVALGRMAAWSLATAAEPAGFWFAQRQAIAERLTGRHEPARLLAWAGAAAAIVLAAVLLTRMPAPNVQRLQAQGNRDATSEASTDPDDVLMAEIQASLRRPVPRPFEPALLVTQELSRAAEQAEAQP